MKEQNSQFNIFEKKIKDHRGQVMKTVNASTADNLASIITEFEENFDKDIQ